jgi:hypothetical protein
MTREESEFQKLLSEAPMAPSADTVTVMGALSRNADPTHFVLTLLNGQYETLEVAAVRSAKKIAGAVGQSLVELELDAKRVPEDVRRSVSSSNFSIAWRGGFGGGGFNPGGGFKIDTDTHFDQIAEGPFVAMTPRHAHPRPEDSVFRTYINGSEWSWDHHIYNRSP